MDSLSSIKKSLKNIAGRVSISAFVAQVKSVNGETCTVEFEGMELSDVRLRAVVNGENSKILITPKKDSFVLATDLSGGNLTDLAVLTFSEIEKIAIDADDTIVINGGKNDGLVKIKELTDKINDLVDWCENHTHAVTPGDGVAAMMGETPLPVSGNIPKPLLPPQQFDKLDYENAKIKH